jgi:hypothetical protein
MEPERRKSNDTTHRSAASDFAHRNRPALVNPNASQKSEADELMRAGISDAEYKDRPSCSKISSRGSTRLWRPKIS